MIHLVSIRFAHNPAIVSGATACALPARKNKDTEHPGFEWDETRSNTATGSVAVYALSDTASRTITIRARLRTTAAIQASVRVRAVDTSPAGGRPGCARAILNLLSGTRINPDDMNINFLGAVQERSVAFNADNRSDELEFTVSGSATETPVDYIMSGRTSWLWQWWNADAARWENIIQTEHTIYAILARPTDPWLTAPTTDPNWSYRLPWTDVLDHACWWARGMKNLTAAASAITEQLYARGDRNQLRYETTSGSPGFAQYNRAEFNLQALLNALAAPISVTNPPRVNCDDCAAILVTFANALGCDLSVAVIGRRSGDIYINPVKAIGLTQWGFLVEAQADDPRGPHFDYHTVAMTGAGTVNDFVFDGLLQLNGSDNPAQRPYRPMLAKHLLFGEAGSSETYRYYLAKSDDNSQRLCSPSEIRRPVIWWVGS